MTDSKTQAAVRRAAADGDPDSQAAVLRLRIRSGTICEEQVRLAAFLGDAGAMRALNTTYPDVVVPPGECIGYDASLQQWLRGLLAVAQKWCLGGVNCPRCDGYGLVAPTVSEGTLAGLVQCHCLSGKVSIDAEQPTAVRAAIAIAEKFHPMWTGQELSFGRGAFGRTAIPFSDGIREWEAITKAKKWLEEPTHQNGQALVDHNLSSPWDAFVAIFWHWDHVRPCKHGDVLMALDFIQQVARWIGVTPLDTQTVIRDGLIPWVLDNDA